MRVIGKILAVIGWVFLGFFAIGFLGLCLMLGSGFRGDNEFATSVIKTDRAVGVVELDGEIVSSDGFRKSLQKVLDNDKIKAVVVRIESPGGAVGASEEIFRAIKTASKPIVCSLGNIAASGGLYAAVGCKKIVVNQGTLTGSIGVILMMPNLASIAEKVGFQMNIVKSGKFKDTGSPFRPFEEADQQLMQSLVNTTYEQFVNAIAEARGLQPEKVKEFADGRIILGEQAVKIGLADEIGGVDQAAALALKLAMPEPNGSPEIIYPKKDKGLLSVFDELSESRVSNWFWSFGRVRLLYQAYL